MEAFSCGCQVRKWRGARRVPCSTASARFRGNAGGFDAAVIGMGAEQMQRADAHSPPAGQALDDVNACLGSIADGILGK